MFWMVCTNQNLSRVHASPVACRSSALAWVACILCSILASCGSSGTKSDKRASPTGASGADASALSTEAVEAAIPWTTEFSKSVLLIADDISVEGPRGLLAHIAVRVVPEDHDQVQKATPNGFLQQVTLKPDGGGGEIKAQLDEMSLVATRRMSVLERPGPVDVVIQARGRVYWRDLSTKQEKRSEAMSFTGKIPR
jgi:hypothetical protein